MSVLEVRQGTQMLEIQDQPLCSFDDLRAIQQIINEKIRGFFKLLPTDHMWRKKLDHLTITPHVALPVFSTFENSLCAENYQFLLIIYQVHDLGRVLEGCNKEGIQHAYAEFKHHGHGSIVVLRDWGIDQIISSQAWQVFEYAIINHVGTNTPALQEPRTMVSDMQYFFTSMLRDIDKLDTFRDTTAKYLYLESKKRAEMKQHGFEEKFSIVPGHFVSQFQRFQSLDRTQIVSYEAYMLYYLSWIFDVNLKPVVQLIVESDAIHWLLQYFEQHVGADVTCQIRQSISNYLDETYSIKLN